MNSIKKITMAVISAILSLIMLTGCNASEIYEYLTEDDNPLKAAELYSDCPGVTFGQVMEKYLASPTWDNKTEDGKNYAVVSGKINGMDLTLTLTALIPEESGGKPEFVKGTLDDTEITPTEDIGMFVSWMFAAYRDGYATFADWTSEHSPEEVLGN